MRRRGRKSVMTALRRRRGRSRGARGEELDKDGVMTMRRWC
jgi:hypothetical protein